MKNKVSILYIEDNPADAYLVKEFLNEINSFESELDHAANITSGIEKLKTGNFDLVLLDLNLPECKNEECIDKIVEQAPSVCLIILTGNNNIEIGQYAIDKGAQDYMQKNYLNPYYLEKTIIFALGRNKQEYYLKNALEAKNKLFSIIAHDLRSPLSNIIGLTNLIENDFENMPKEELKFLLNTQNNVGQALFNLLENLLQWSKINLKAIKPELKQISLNDLIGKSIEVNKANALLKSIVVDFKYDEEIYKLTDSNLLQTAIRNLISNAIKFTPAGGIVSIRLYNQNGKPIFEIKDSGIGIPKEFQENLFKPGFKTNRLGTNNEPSSGLGLVLVYEIINLLNGSIEFQSKENVGTLFKITLSE